MGHKTRIIWFGRLALFCVCVAAAAHAAEVRGRVSVVAQNGALHADRNNGVVVWLTPLSDEANSELRAQSAALISSSFRRTSVSVRVSWLCKWAR